MVPLEAARIEVLANAAKLGNGDLIASKDQPKVP